MKPLILTEKTPIRFSELQLFFQSSISISNECVQRIQSCQSFIQKEIDNQKVMYGVNTGFGQLCNTQIPTSDLSLLQYNLIRSHACGVGKPIAEEIVRKMVFLKALSLAQGYSGVSLETVERLVFFYNHALTPEVFEYGSLGASGDLAPLAHIALCMIGEGYFRIQGKRIPAAEIFAQYDLKPIALGPKEGIALLNGTQFMLAHLVHILEQTQNLITASACTAALSLDAYVCRLDAFDHDIQRIRNQKGQIEIARFIRELLADSEIAKTAKQQVQDAYSFRCIPQVHGASIDAYQYALSIAEREWNGVTDNPNIFWVEGKIISGGNFHGQPLALCLDHLKLAIHELAHISERRIFKLLDGTRGLPAFLAPQAGLNSGFMICQYTAAALVSANKQYCSPASADSIVSSNGQEDHVSMGANAAIQCLALLENAQQVIGIEWFTAAQAYNFRFPATTSRVLQQLHSEFRQQVPFLQSDTILNEYLIFSKEFIVKKDWKGMLNADFL